MNVEARAMNGSMREDVWGICKRAGRLWGVLVVLAVLLAPGCGPGGEQVQPTVPAEDVTPAEQAVVAPDQTVSEPASETAGDEQQGTTADSEPEPADEASQASDEPAAPTVPPGATVAMIPMRDGVQLEAHYYLPKGKDSCPVIVARSVYDKTVGAAFAAIFGSFGAALVIQDTRGRGGSEGEDRLFADDGWGERQDGVDTIKWVKEQPWCSGDVAMFGMSALGITEVLMAPVSPPLECQVIWVAPSKFYGQLSYQGGVFRKALSENWTAGQGNSHLLETWRAHPCDDEFWAGYDAEARAATVQAPSIHVGGWWDIFAEGTIKNFTSRQHRGGDGARGNQMLIVGPWTHGGPIPGFPCGELTFPANSLFDINGASLRFIQHWLIGADNGIMDEPAVRYYTVGDTSDPEAPGNEWREAEDWPPFETVETPYYLAPDDSLTKEAPAADAPSVSYAYDPADPCPTRGGANLTIEAGSFDQQELAARPDVLVFVTPALEEPVEVTGQVRVRLHVSSDAPDTDFTVKLIDVYPDGRQMLIMDNIHRLKFRNGFEKPESLPAGEMGELTVDLGPISIIFNAGHRIGLQISSSNYPRFEKNPNTGADFPTEDGESRVATNTIYLDQAHPSALLLPDRP